MHTYALLQARILSSGKKHGPSVFMFDAVNGGPAPLPASTHRARSNNKPDAPDARHYGTAPTSCSQPRPSKPFPQRHENKRAYLGFRASFAVESKTTELYIYPYIQHIVCNHTTVRIEREAQHQELAASDLGVCVCMCEPGPRCLQLASGQS